MTLIAGLGQTRSGLFFESAWKRRLGLFALWTFVGLFFGLRTGLEWELIGRNSWAKAIWWHLMEWYFWGILANGVFRLCRRAQIGRHRRLRYCLFHLGLGLVISFIQAFLCTVAGLVERWAQNTVALTLVGEPYSFSRALHLTVVNHLHQNMLIYAAIILVWHALDFQRQSRAKAIEASELETRLAGSQLKALRAQLQPHFLFNTLNTIAELIHESPHKADRMILRLGDLLRLSLQSEAQAEVPLEEEMHFLKCYLEIEQERLGDRLEVRWDVAHETLPAKVPNFILQPLVENAIRHGIAPFSHPGMVTIRTRRENDKLLLQVRDNGPGMGAQREPRAGSIGLMNTRERLTRLYGDKHLLELLDDNGLVARLTIPYAS
jgi:two-component system, LytTR family, sensor kinase